MNERDAVEDRNLPCMATGEMNVDGAVVPVACDLWLGHDRSHYDQAMIVFWGREHGGREYAGSDRPAMP